MRVLPKTYGRARLFLGISGVGLFVLVSIIAIWNHWPQYFLSGLGANFQDEIKGLVAFIVVYVLISLPLDFLGGYFVPRWYGRRSSGIGPFIVAWSRGVLVHSSALLLIALAILQAGKIGGMSLAFVVVFFVMIFLLLVQKNVARYVGEIKPSRVNLSETKKLLHSWGIRSMPPLSVYASKDEGFTGGISGFPGQECIIIPRLWIKKFDSETLALLVARRVALIKHSGRTKGAVVGFGWNLLGFATAGFLIPGAGVESVAELTTLSLGFTVWSFLGLLILPSLSRYGVFSADRYATSYDDGNRLERAIRLLDRLQDDEPKRPVLVETIFHPLPSVESRLKRIAQLKKHPKNHRLGNQVKPWNAARSSLYLSWGGLGLLSRAVHCNVGRPDLWVFLPVD
ncbi:MAG: hypothetical protein ACFCU1_01120 [Sumerlaeia bacterium]